MVGMGRFVPHEAKSRSAAVGNPQIQISVLVPINLRDGPPVVRKIKAGNGRDVGKFTLRGGVGERVEETTVSFVSTERPAFSQHLA